MMASTQTPLFLPLKSRFYDEFAAGRKTYELRCYGPRWNEKTCPVGRPVVLSRGYGKQARMQGRITEFDTLPAWELHRDDWFAVVECYGVEKARKLKMAWIGIEVERGAGGES